MVIRRNWRTSILLAAIILPLLAAATWYGCETLQANLDRALIQAVKRRDTATAISLLRTGANANAEDGLRKPLSFGTLLGNFWYRLKGVKSARQTDDDAPGMSRGIGRTALMWAAYQSDSRLVGELLERGANVNLQDHDGISALWIATERSDIAVSTGAEVIIVRQLLEHHARVDLQNSRGESIFDLIHEMERPDPEIVLLLNRARKR
jgi:hypothetical protein